MIRAGRIVPWLLLTMIVVDCSASTHTSDASPIAIPGSAARLDDSIDNLDFSFDGETLHLVWVVTHSGTQKAEARYLQCSARTGSWSNAVTVGTCEAGPVRVVRTSSGELHVLASRGLLHWVSSDSGKSWSLRDELGPETRMAITGFDAIAFKGEVLVTYMASMRRAEQPRTASRVVLGTIRGSGGEPDERVLFTGAHARPISPRILTSGDTLSLFCVISETPRDTKPSSRLLRFQSWDGGRRWSEPELIQPISAASEFITDFDAALVDGETLVFYRVGVLYFVRSTGSHSWTTPVRVALPEPSVATRSYQAYSPSCASDGRRGRVAWIDTRFQRSDISVLNPLGGIPWSDQPDWVNSDIMSLPISKFVSSPSDAIPGLSPIRHTADLSMATAVKAEVRGDSLDFIWAGRSKVGRGRTDAGEPPQLFHAVLAE